MNKKIFISIVPFLLLACGGGGGNAGDGGFQRGISPELNVSVSPNTILPNASGARYEGLTSDAIAVVNVQALQGSVPVEDGDEELSVTINNAISTTNGVVYCFIIGKEECTMTVKDEEGNDVEVLRPLTNVSLDLADGLRRFAVTSTDGKPGKIGVTVTVNGPNNARASKDILIPVEYKSSGVAQQITINAAEIMRPNQPSNIYVVVTDEAGNPVPDSEQDNIIVTATNLSDTTLGFNGESGVSVNAKTSTGVAEISVLPTQNGYLTVTAQSDSADNNIENGIERLITSSKTIRVTNEAIPVVSDVIVLGGVLPNAVVGVDYGEFTITTNGPVSDISIQSGDFPSGMSFEQGVISGVPTVSGEFTFTVEVTGTNGSTDTKEFTLNVIEGGFEFSRDSFDTIDGVTKNLDPNIPDVCQNVAQILEIQPTGDYTLQPPFTWEIDAGGVPTALGANTATRVVTANGVDLPDLEFTVTDDTTQVTLNGQMCPDAPSDVFNGHAIILNATDANGFKFESVLPLIINLEVVPYTPSDDSDDDLGFSPQPGP